MQTAHCKSIELRLKSSETQASTLKRQVIAVNSVLQQRQEREHQAAQYCMHLETAIREQNLYPQITSRVNELLGSDPKPDKNQLKLQVEFDNVSRDLHIARMSKAELESEN